MTHRTAMPTRERRAHALTRQEDDIRGRAVIGLDGDVVGSVHDAVLDDGDEQRFLVVGSRGFLGIGRHAFLVPIEAITSITEDHVFVGETSLRMLGGVPYDPSLDIDDDYLASVYRHYRVDAKVVRSSRPRVWDSQR